MRERETESTVFRDGVVDRPSEMESIGEMLLGFRRGSETREREEELKKTAHASPVTAVLDWTIGYSV